MTNNITEQQPSQRSRGVLVHFANGHLSNPNAMLGNNLRFVRVAEKTHKGPFTGMFFVWATLYLVLSLIVLAASIVSAVGMPIQGARYFATIPPSERAYLSFAPGQAGDFGFWFAISLAIAVFDVVCMSFLILFMKKIQMIGKWTEAEPVGGWQYWWLRHKITHTLLPFVAVFVALGHYVFCVLGVEYVPFDESKYPYDWHWRPSFQTADRWRWMFATAALLLAVILVGLRLRLFVQIFSATAKQSPVPLPPQPSSNSSPTSPIMPTSALTQHSLVFRDRAIVWLMKRGVFPVYVEGNTALPSYETTAADHVNVIEKPQAAPMSASSSTFYDAANAPNAV